MTAAQDASRPEEDVSRTGPNLRVLAGRIMAAVSVLLALWGMITLVAGVRSG